MDLKTAVARYLEKVAGFGCPLPLAQLGAAREEIEAALSAWDEDYHLHRHFELLPAAPERPASEDNPAGQPAGDAAYRINGIPYTAIIFRESIRHVLGDTPQ